MGLINPNGHAACVNSACDGKLVWDNAASELFAWEEFYSVTIDNGVEVGCTKMDHNLEEIEDRNCNYRNNQYHYVCQLEC